MTGHTKGPWFVQGARIKVEGQSAHAVSRYDEEKKQDEQICAVWYDPKTHLGFADARLISAAPDLLEFAKAQEAWEADVIINGDWSNEMPRLTQAQYDRMIELQEVRRAAISKAEGQ